MFTLFDECTRLLWLIRRHLIQSANDRATDPSLNCFYFGASLFRFLNPFEKKIDPMKVGKFTDLEISIHLLSFSLQTRYSHVSYRFQFTRKKMSFEEQFQ